MPNKKEYIERGAVFPNGVFVIDGKDTAKSMVEFVNHIMDIPAADVVEVKHGEWLQTKEPLGHQDVDCIECSVCHDSWVIDEDFDFEFHKQYWNYCPNCGAKMDSRRFDDEDCPYKCPYVKKEGKDNAERYER